MINWRLVAVAAFIGLVGLGLAWLSFAWMAVNFMNAPCDNPDFAEPCSQYVPWTFLTRGLLPVAAVLGIAGWLTFRDWSKK